MVALPGVGDIIAVSSTKGGVGKSTVAVNLACALVRLGRRVGMLDADIYGPSLPTMLGLSGRPRVAEETKVLPLEKYGLRVMSMGFFLDDSSPVIWRGPLVTGLLRQFLKDVQWGELDVLVVDLPPGTGDAQLTLVQQVPLSGGVVVTTPQAVSVIDVERGIAMFNQVNTPVLGIVENMSAYVCPHCGTRDELFGSGGAARLAAEFGVPLLGRIPIVPDVRASGDAGDAASSSRSPDTGQPALRRDRRAGARPHRRRARSGAADRRVGSPGGRRAVAAARLGAVLVAGAAPSTGITWRGAAADLALRPPPALRYKGARRTAACPDRSLLCSTSRSSSARASSACGSTGAASRTSPAVKGSRLLSTRVRAWYFSNLSRSRRGSCAPACGRSR